MHDRCPAKWSHHHSPLSSVYPNSQETSGPAGGGSPVRGRTPFAKTFKSPTRGSRSVHEAAESKAKEAAAGAYGVEPKVFVPHARQVGLPPRKVEVERKKRFFAQQRIEELLAAEGVDWRAPEPSLSSDPAAPTSTSAPGSGAGAGAGAGASAAAASSSAGGGGGGDGGYLASLPLEAFDNTDFEVRAPADWIQKGAASGGGKGVPAQALVRDAAGAGVEWRDGHAVSWDPSVERFTVEFSDQKTLAAEVPRLDLLFMAEDPFNFARRVANAHKSRREAEALLRYNLYVDCMPTDDTPQLSTEQVNRVLSSALNNAALKQGGADVSNLLSEVNIDYRRTMNKIIFDINLQQAGGQGEHMFFHLPEKPAEAEAPELGVVPIPAHNFVEQFSSFSFNSFLTKYEVIQALVKVRAECNRVLDIGRNTGGQVGFLNSSITKTGRLDEFEHVQNTAITSFATMLQESWVVTVKNHINSCLKNVGKGWFNLKETSKEVYEFSKLKKFLTMVNFIMQDTLRFFVEDSLRAYTRFIEAACEGIVTVKGPNDVHLEFPPSGKREREMSGRTQASP